MKRKTQKNLAIKAGQFTLFSHLTPRISSIDCLGSNMFGFHSISFDGNDACSTSTVCSWKIMKASNILRMLNHTALDLLWTIPPQLWQITKSIAVQLKWELWWMMQLAYSFSCCGLWSPIYASTVYFSHKSAPHRASRFTLITYRWRSFRS